MKERFYKKQGSGQKSLNTDQELKNSISDYSDSKPLRKSSISAAELNNSLNLIKI